MKFWIALTAGALAWVALVVIIDRLYEEGTRDGYR